MIKIAYLDEEPGWQSLFYDKFWVTCKSPWVKLIHV
jgi:hypothetical protein